MTDSATEQLRQLVQTQRTLVLGTADPWTAPVYFVYRPRRFYFFSSPSSRHIVAAAGSGRCAGSIFRDGNDWRDIEGLQMDGRLETVAPGTEALAVFGDYVRKFPTVKEFFVEATLDISSFLQHFRTRLYAFIPDQAHYLNNQLGFARRRAVELPS